MKFRKIDENKEIEVSNEEARLLLTNPNFIPIDQNKFYLKDENGDLFHHTNINDFREDIASDPNVQVLTPFDVEVDESKKSTLDTLKAGAAGAARGLTFGVSDAVLSALGQKEDLRILEEAHPIASTVGEVGSLIVPAVVGAATGGAGTVAAGAKAVGVLTRLAEKGAVAAGEKALAKTGSKFAATGVEALTRGAMYGAGSGISNIALSDAPLTGSGIAGELVFDTAMGAISDAVMTGGMHGLGRVGKAIANSFPGITESPNNAAKWIAKKVSAPTKNPELTEEVILQTKKQRDDLFKKSTTEKLQEKIIKINKDLDWTFKGGENFDGIYRDGMMTIERNLKNEGKNISFDEFLVASDAAIKDANTAPDIKKTLKHIQKIIKQDFDSGKIELPNKKLIIRKEELIPGEPDAAENMLANVGKIAQKEGAELTTKTFDDLFDAAKEVIIKRGAKDGAYAQHPITKKWHKIVGTSESNLPQEFLTKHKLEKGSNLILLEDVPTPILEGGINKANVTSRGIGFRDSNTGKFTPLTTADIHIPGEPTKDIKLLNELREKTISNIDNNKSIENNLKLADKIYKKLVDKEKKFKTGTINGVTFDEAQLLGDIKETISSNIPGFSELKSTYSLYKKLSGILNIKNKDGTISKAKFNRLLKQDSFKDINEELSKNPMYKEDIDVIINDVKKLTNMNKEIIWLQKNQNNIMESAKNLGLYSLAADALPGGKIMKTIATPVVLHKAAKNPSTYIKLADAADSTIKMHDATIGKLLEKVKDYRPTKTVPDNIAVHLFNNWKDKKNYQEFLNKIDTPKEEYPFDTNDPYKDDITVKMQKIQDYLSKAAPRGVQGEYGLVPPTDRQLSEFADKVAPATKPVELVTSAIENNIRLTPTQIKVLQELHPEVFAVIAGLNNETIIPKTTNTKKFQTLHSSKSETKKSNGNGVTPIGESNISRATNR